MALRLPLVVCSISLVLAACVNPPVVPEQPDILLVVADDLGHWACGPCGNREVQTPTMDRLAASGVWFANATSPSPVCSPARLSLLTGRLPSQHGVHDFLSETPEFDRDWLVGEVLLPELLQQAGYYTALVGKWHLSANGVPPAGLFDRYTTYDVAAEGWQNQYLHRGTVHLLEDGGKLAIEGFQGAGLAQRAVAVVEERPREQPLFLVFAPTDTHAPFTGHPDDLVERYRSAQFMDIPRDETSSLPAAGPHAVMPEDPTEMLAQYYAAVSAQDAWIEEVVAAFSENLPDTLVIVTSDHGHMNGHHGLVGKANATLPQNLYDEVVRVPLLMSWPARLGAGLSSKLFVDHLDLFVTILDAAGATLDESMTRRIDSPGRSLLPTLAGVESDWRSYRYSEHGNARLVASTDFKLIRRYPPQDQRFGDELYDLVADPRETTNLIDDPAYSSQRAELEHRMEEHFSRYEVPGNSGATVKQLPAFNGREPWTRMEAGSHH